MFVVRRTFKDPLGGLMRAGSIVEPASMKYFKYRLNEKQIIEVTEQNFEQCKNYFKVKYGVDIPDLSVGNKPMDKAVCPKCSHEWEVPVDADPATIVCPECGYDEKAAKADADAKAAEEAAKAEAAKAVEVKPVVKAATAKAVTTNTK